MYIVARDLCMRSGLWIVNEMGRDVKRFGKIITSFLQLHPLTCRIVDAAKDMKSFNVSLYRFERTGDGQYLLQSAISTLGVVAAIFENRAAKIVREVSNLSKALDRFVCAIMARDLSNITLLFWKVVLSSLILSLVVFKSMKLTLAYELVDGVVALNQAVKEVRGKRRPPEIVANLAVACIRGYSGYKLRLNIEA